MARWRRYAVGAQDLPDGGGGHPVPEPAQLALDPDHTPPGVLPGQAHDQRDELVSQRRTARRPGLAPLGRHQPPVPAQQRARSHDPPGPEPLLHDPRQRGENGPISPGHPRSGVRPAQHGHFVPQREYLHILGRRGPGQQRQPGQHGHQQPVSQRDRHACRSCRHQNPGQAQQPSIRPLHAGTAARRRNQPPPCPPGTRCAAARRARRPRGASRSARPKTTRQAPGPGSSAGTGPISPSTPWFLVMWCRSGL